MNKRKLLVLSDSLSLPRSIPEKADYHLTWPQLLKQDFIIHQASIGGGTIIDLLKQVEYHKHFNPDIIILQSGIVDCAPRALRVFELGIIKRIWGGQSLILPFVKRNGRLIRKFRKITYTSPNIFKKSLEAIQEAMPLVEFWGLGILPVSHEYEEKVPGIRKRVTQYNTILANFFKERFISLDSIDTSFVMADHIHLNNSGQRFVYERIMDSLRKIDA